MSCLSGASNDPASALCFFFFFPVYFWRGHTGVNYKEPRESCPSHAVRCDGVEDCKLKSDELGCGKEVGCVRVFVRALWGLQTGFQLKWEVMDRDLEDLGSSPNRLGSGTWL